jgi:hypothetical protein
MNVNEWNDLYKSDRSSYLKAYEAFMYDKENICKCSKCPMNSDKKKTDIYPCGQRNCWVACACHIGVE